MRRVPHVCVPIIALTLACSGDKKPTATANPAPAAVAHATTEAELTVVTLTPQAVARLAIQSVPATVERVAETRTLGGEVVVPEGRSIVVSAPVAGRLTEASGVTAGARVSRGQTVFRLIPLAAAERDQSIEAQRAVSAAAAEEQAAAQRLQRLELLLKDGATSVKAVEEARAQHEVAAAGLKAAQQSLVALRRNPVGAQGELAIAAPLAGVLQSINAAAGQTVAAGAPLFQISQVATLWVRVPVYAGDARMIDASKPATVTLLDGNTAPRTARRVVAPPKADPGAASIDLFFELSSDGPPLQPGERVAVQLPLSSSTEGLSVPESAIVYDINGTAWVYEDVGQGKYARRRVEIARLVGDRAVIARGIAAGTRVVSVGAAELFGTEFGAGH